MTFLKKIDEGAGKVRECAEMKKTLIFQQKGDLNPRPLLS
jgi:hypothetical protein